MNRLTKIDEKGYYIDDPSVHWDGKRRGPEITQLGKYEDTGFSPESLSEFKQVIDQLVSSGLN